VLSAEGATSTSARGVAPGVRLQQQQALKARFNQQPIIELVSEMNRVFSAAGFSLHESWGVALGSGVRRPVGAEHLLNTYAAAFRLNTRYAILRFR